MLCKSGLQLVDQTAAADIVIVNTCAFIHPAKEEAIDEILTLVEEKKRTNRKFQIVVAGCLAQRYGKELFSQIPEVDLFVGTGEVGNIASHINRLNRHKSERAAVITQPDFLMTAGHERVLSPSAVSAFLKISDGCSNNCSYCVIPSIRGQARSRKPNDILKEAENLAARGIKEIIIIGQDTTAYGRDLKGQPRLADLLNGMAKINTIRWIRLLYAHPAHITGEMLSTMAANKKVCRYIDLPIQHIDDSILQAMGRKVTSVQIKEIITQARKIMPNVALRTSLIVGFPGETKKRFERLLDFVREIKFDHLGVFTYSREEGTKAAEFKSQVSEAEKERRREIIMSEQADISNGINKSLIGTTQEVLIEEKSDRADFAWMGRCRRQAPEIDGITYIRDGKAQIGKIVKCQITDADDYDLFAEIIK